MSYLIKNIKKIRATKKLSQAAFAELFDLTRSSIGAYEEGRAEPKMETIINIAKHFSISLDSLLTKELTVNEIFHFDPSMIAGTPPTQAKFSRPKKQAMTPWITTDKIAEYTQHHANKDFLMRLPTVKFPLPHPSTKSRAFEATKDMLQVPLMGISLQEGDLIYCIEHTTSSLPMNSLTIHAIITKGKIHLGRMEEKDQVILLTTTSYSSTIEIIKNEIEEIWIVYGIYAPLHKNRQPSLEQRVVDLEKEMATIKATVKENKKAESRKT